MQFYLRFEDFEKLKQLKKKSVFLIGGYNGYGKNFGDLLELKNTASFYRNREYNVFTLMHIQAISNENWFNDFKILFPEVIPIFWGKVNNEKSLNLKEIKKTDISFEILHLYGGGFLNEFWGRVVIQSVEEAFFTFEIKRYLITGQQISEKVIDAFKKHISIFNPQLIGVRDKYSLFLLKRAGILNAIYSGDDAWELLEKLSKHFKKYIKRGNDFAIFHFNLSNYVISEDVNSHLNEIRKLILTIKKRGIRKFLFFHAYDRNSILVKDTLRSLEYLEILKWIPCLKIISIPWVLPFLNSPSNLDVFIEENSLRDIRVKYAFVNSYHMGMFIANLSIPVYLFSHNTYYKQKGREFSNQETSFDFLKNIDAIFEFQQNQIKKISENRREFLRFFEEILSKKKPTKINSFNKYTYQNFPVESILHIEIDDYVNQLLKEKEKLLKEKERIKRDKFCQLYLKIKKIFF